MTSAASPGASVFDTIVSSLSEPEKVASSMGFYISKCGGTVLPCSEGAMFSSKVVKSSLKLAGPGMSIEFAELESTRDAIKTSIAANSNGAVFKHQITIVKITAASRRLNVDAGIDSARQLQAGGINVDYQVTIQGSADSSQSDASVAATQKALTSIPPAALVTTMNANLPTPLSNLAAVPAATTSTSTVTAVSPNASEDSGMSSGAIAGIAIAGIAFVGIAAAGAVFIMKRQDRKAPTNPVQQQTTAQSRKLSDPNVEAVQDNPLNNPESV